MKNPSALMALMAALMLGSAIQAEVPRSAVKAVEAYREGNYAMARDLFRDALQECLLRADAEGVFRSGLNLADIEMEMDDPAKAAEILKSLPEPSEEGLRQGLAWKKAQSLVHLGRPRDAQEAMKKVENACRKERYVFCREVSADLMRLDFSMGVNQAELEKRVVNWKKGLSKAELPQAWELEAKLAMLKKDYARAEQLWEMAAKYWGEGPRRAGRMAECLGYLGLCRAQEGRLKEALMANDMAQQACATMGLRRKTLRMKTLRLVMLDGEERTRALSEISLIAGADAGFDPVAVLKEYGRFADLPRFILPAFTK